MKSALEFAVRSQYLPLIQLLLQQPTVDVNIRTKQPSHLDFTPLHWAIFQNNFQIAQLLVKAKDINVNAKVRFFQSLEEKLTRRRTLAM